jgi:hypothetical protein
MTGFGKQMSWVRRVSLGCVAVAALGTAAVAFANPPAPSLKPAAAAAAKSVWIEAADFSLLVRALDAADANQWSQVKTLLGRISDPAAQALVRWRILTDGNGGSGFNELRAAVEEFKDWPDRDKIEDQMEITIQRSPLTAEERISWLAARGPRTGEGVLALADAYNSQGRTDDMYRVAREAWRTRPMGSETARTLQAMYGAQLTEDDHYARADMFLWRGDTASAQAMVSKLSSGRKAVIEARIALIKNGRNIDKLVGAVPQAYADDAGLLYERARHAERQGAGFGRAGLPAAHQWRERAGGGPRGHLDGEAVGYPPHAARAELPDGVSAGGGAWADAGREFPRCGVDGGLAGADADQRRAEGRGALHGVRRGRDDADQRVAGAVLAGRGAQRAGTRGGSAGGV